MEKVNCTEHGAQGATFVCRHLVESYRTGEKVGFFPATDNPSDPRPHAWCALCEKKRIECGGEWCDESEAFCGVSVMCGQCYDTVKEINS